MGLTILTGSYGFIGVVRDGATLRGKFISECRNCKQ